MLKVPDAVKSPVAVIESPRGKVIVTDLKDDDGNYIILPTLKNSKSGYSLQETKSIYGRTVMPTLIGSIVDGDLVANAGTTIDAYKKIAEDILGTCPEQFRAPANTFDVIESITKNVQTVKQSFSPKRSTERDADSKLTVESDEDGEQLTQGLEGRSVAKYSLRSWKQSDQAKIRESLIEAGFDCKDVDKWADDVNSVAAVIAANKDRLDYKASEVQTFLNEKTVNRPLAER